MRIFYACDGEQTAVNMSLDSLINNLLSTDAGIDVARLREEVELRGWFTGTHDSGGFLVLNLDAYSDFIVAADPADDTDAYPGQHAWKREGL